MAPTMTRPNPAEQTFPADVRQMTRAGIPMVLWPDHAPTATR